MTFISNPYFLQFIVPLSTIALSIFLKISSRNDRHHRFKKEDLSIGLEITVNALIIFIAETTSLVQQLSTYDPIIIEKITTVPWLIFVFLTWIMIMSTAIRWYGWNGDEDMKLWAIVIPDVVGLGILFLVANWIN